MTAILCSSIFGFEMYFATAGTQPATATTNTADTTPTTEATETTIITKEEKEVKTTINELLNVDQYLFLKTDRPYIDSKVSYLINADTGQVLYDDDGDFPLPILSVSKTLSAYVILDEMKKNPEKYNWDTRIKAVGKPVLVSYEYNFSNLSLYENQEYTLRELFEGIMIKSANSATMLVGQEMFGSEKQFVAALRQKAQELNLKKTEIYTSTGLAPEDLIPFGYDDLEPGINKMSAEDISYLTIRLLKDYPEILEITSKPGGVFATLTDEPFEYDATNGLLPGYEYEYAGVTGLKTGADLYEYTSNIVFTANRNGVNLIGVILGSRDSDIRSQDAINLMEYGFNLLHHKHFITSETKLFNDGTLRVKFASKNKVHVTVAQDLVLSTSFDDLKPTFMFVPTNVKYNAKYDAFEGEIKTGEVLGYITVNYGDLNFLTETTAEHYHVDVVATEDVGKGFFIFNGFEYIIDRIKDIF